MGHKPVDTDRLWPSFYIFMISKTMDKKLTRIRFRDAAIEQQFERDGYIVLKNFADAAMVDRMRAVFEAYYVPPTEKMVCWNSAVNVGEDEKKQISAELLKLLTPQLRQHIDSYMDHFGYFLTKPADETATNLAIHRDASAVDEKQFEYLIFWMPLVDINKETGYLYLMPGSNRLFEYELPFGVSWPYKHLDSELQKYAVKLDLKAGDAAIFSGKTLHGSYANMSGAPRPVVCCGLVDPATELMYYYYDREKNNVEAYTVSPDFFLQSDFSHPKEKYPLRFSFEYQPPKLTGRDISDFYKKNWSLYKGHYGMLDRIRKRYFSFV